MLDGYQAFIQVGRPLAVASLVVTVWVDCDDEIVDCILEDWGGFSVDQPASFEELALLSCKSSRVPVRRFSKAYVSVFFPTFVATCNLKERLNFEVDF